MKRFLTRAPVDARGRNRVSFEARLKLGAALAVLARLAVTALVLGSAGGAASAPYLPTRCCRTRSRTGMGYHGERRGAVDPRGQEPGRAPASYANNSTIVATEQVGRVYDGGASDIGYEVSVNGGQSWKHGELPLTIQGGQADTCGGPLTRASDTVTAYDAEARHLARQHARPLGNGANVPAVYINRGTAELRRRSDIDWEPADLPAHHAAGASRRTRTGSRATTGRTARATATATSSGTTTATATARSCSARPTAV